MKPYRTFKSVVHAVASLREAMERYRRTGQFILSTDNPSAYEYEDTRPESLELRNVAEYKADPFVMAAIGDNSQVGSVPASGADAPEPSSSAPSPEPSHEPSATD